MKKENKREESHNDVPDLMFQDVKIPESLAPTPINPALDDANQLNIPRNPAASHALDWDIPDEPLVTDEKVHATPNPHTNRHRNRRKK